MKSDSFCKLSCKPCWQFDDWIQMACSSQIVRLYRVSERPNTGQKGHNQAWKRDKRRQTGHRHRPYIDPTSTLHRPHIDPKCRVDVIDKRKSYSIDCIKSSLFHKMKTSPPVNVIELFFPGPLYCCVSIKTVNNQTLRVFYCWLENNNNNSKLVQ